MAQAAKSENKVGGETGTRVIPLALAHLVEPYRNKGPLSLRIERMPQGGRFSSGSRNNNGSWSLTLSDLDGLTYTPAAGVPAEHALALRIISLVGGDTLAVVDVPVSESAADAPAASEAKPTAAAVVGDKQLDAIAGELASVRAVLAASEAASGELRRQVEAATALSKQNAEAALEAARTAWQAETDRRLAEAGAQTAAALAEQRKAWESEHAAALAAAERAKSELAEALAKADAAWQEKAAKQVADARAERDAARAQNHEAQLGPLREQLQVAEAKLAERERAIEQAAKAAEEASARQRRDADEALAKAEANWKAAEAARVSAMEAEWRDKLAKASAPRVDDGVVNELRGEVTALKATIAERDRSLRDAQDALSAAEQSWKSAEAARVSAIEAEWRGKLAKASAPSTDDGAMSALRQEVTALNAAIAERDRALTESKDALAKAEKTWKEAEASRVSALEAEWRDKLARASAAPASTTDDGAANELRGEVAVLKTKLEERDRAIAAAEKAVNDARETAQSERKAALAKANEEWSAAEAKRFAAFEAEWQEKLAKAQVSTPPSAPAPTSAPAADPAQQKEIRRLREQIATLQGILEDREEKSSRDGEAARLASELAKARAKAKDEITALKATLTQRDSELARAKAAAGTATTPHALADFEAAARPSFRVRDAVNRQDDTGAQDKGHLLRDLMFAAVAGGALVFFYPDIEALILGEQPTPVRAIPMPRPKPELPAPPVVPDRTATAARNANLRAAPTTAARVVGSLAKDLSVIVIEERDGWFLVNVDGAPGKEPTQGWVKDRLLKDVMPLAAPAPQ